MAVNIAPVNIPRIGLENLTKIPLNPGTSASGATAPLIKSIPNIKIVNPKKIVPISFFFSLFENIKNPIPIMANTGANEVGLNKFTITLSLCIPVKLKTHAVIVVPTLAPIITPIAWDNFIIPEFTKPTAITVVADDD